MAKCAMCKTVIATHSKNVKYCEACRKEKIKAYQRLYHAKYYQDNKSRIDEYNKKWMRKKRLEIAISEWES